MIHVPNPNRATHVPLFLRVDDGLRLATQVNQRLTDDLGFTRVGLVDLPAGKRTTITVSNQDTDGFVSVDGIQLLPIGK